MKKKTWANVVLAASAVLTAAAAPYKDISLLAEGCFHLGFAATVGGFADWFGVASLFGKPLGIGKRTDIIAKDRDKIIRLARDMITQELLTRQQIKALVVKNVPTDVLYRWILSHEAGVKNVLDAAALLSLVLWIRRNSGVSSPEKPSALLRIRTGQGRSLSSSKNSVQEKEASRSSKPSRVKRRDFLKTNARRTKLAASTFLHGKTTSRMDFSAAFSAPVWKTRQKK